MKKTIFFLFSILAVLCLGFYIWISNSNNFKRDGFFKISVNEKPIRIVRDKNGIAYVIAQNKADVIRGQGFVNAQDRLFQIELYRALIRGEGASIVGSSMLNSDIQMVVLDIYGNAKRSYKYLDSNAKDALRWYCEGFNEYLNVGKDEFPLELGLLDIEPKELDPVDILSVIHFIGFFHSQNMDDEILSLNLSASIVNASDFLPLSVNLDRKRPLSLTNNTNINSLKDEHKLSVLQKKKWTSLPSFGSNNWAVSSKKSTTGKPILANDPHVDARILPGTFYPVGLFCPEFKAVGIATPGVPGLLSGRNEFVSFGVTNAYGDSQDLYLEEIKDNYYLQDSSWVPLEIREITIKVKDSTDVQLTIRKTKRGPIISDFPVFKIQTKDQVSLRWSLAETKSPSFGFDRLLEAKDVKEFRESLYTMDANFFNYTIADIHGNIAHQATGLVPIRKNKNGNTPLTAHQDDNWQGFIPKDELPNMVNPPRGWVGTANHDTRPDDYPYYYSNHFSPYYRYKRLKQVLDNTKTQSPDDLWGLILDTKNTQAEAFVPVFVNALSKDKKTKELAEILSNWNHKDDIHEVGATVYNYIYNELLYLVFNDELPDHLENQYWENVYYWNQRLDDYILKDHHIVDDISTENKETLNEMIIKAGVNIQEVLNQKFGQDKSTWIWGKAHTISFKSPLKQEGFGSAFLGGETLPKQGSNQTLNRGAFIKNKNHLFDVSWFSSFRMVADMSDNEKIRGVVSGGSSARVFHPYYKSQLKSWKKNDWLPYWLSLKKLEQHKSHELILK